MPIHTTYLAHLDPTNPFKRAKVAPANGCYYLFYVMRNRGNNEVAPSKDLLTHYKMVERQTGITSEVWQLYVAQYLSEIRRSADARIWMEARAVQAIHTEVILVCYEKNADRCHRKLLAEEIVRQFGEKYNALYVGELP